MEGRPRLVVCGQVVVRALPDRLELAEAVGLEDGRVASVGRRDDVLAAAHRDARVIDAGPAAVVPGIHDFHLHLIGMARARREISLDQVGSRDEVLRLLVATAARAEPREMPWILGSGWREEMIDPEALNSHPSLRDRAILVYSHDAHSAWASPAALVAAGLDELSADPAGGRIERDAGGRPTGILRERASDPVEAVAGRLDGSELARALDEALAELAAWGVTGATDAGDALVENGIGPVAALGDRASRLLDLRARIDGRLRVTVNVPADALEAASALGMATGTPIPETETMRAGWAKAYADGALGSRTAALFAPYSCDGSTDAGIVRLGDEELDALTAASREHRIGLAVHAIGDRAAATVLDAIERAGPPTGPAADRMEHLQLVRPQDRLRLARMGIVASVQPVHAASDRDLVEACWAGRVPHAYAWRSIADAGAPLAFGSDAPIESADPWLGMYCAVHRRFPADGRADWHPEQGVGVPAALAAYTISPARAIGAVDEGHLEVGAHADLAVLNVDLATLASASEEMASVKAVLTIVAGREVHAT